MSLVFIIASSLLCCYVSTCIFVLLVMMVTIQHNKTRKTNSDLLISFYVDGTLTKGKSVWQILKWTKQRPVPSWTCEKTRRNTQTNLWEHGTDTCWGLSFLSNLWRLGIQSSEYDPQSDSPKTSHSDEEVDEIHHIYFRWQSYTCAADSLVYRYYFWFGPHCFN